MHQGQFKPHNPQKYVGNHTNIIYRSSWELSVMLWCDKSPAVVEWSSEELIIPYLCPTDNSWHRYFVDFTVTLTSGETLWVELKPHKYTKPPEKSKKLTRRYITETVQFVKNCAKWAAADELAKQHGAKFQVWTENTLKALNIKILGK